MPSVRAHTRGLLREHRRPAGPRGRPARARRAWPRSPPRGSSAGSSTRSPSRAPRPGRVDRLAIGLAVAIVAQTVLTWAARRVVVPAGRGPSSPELREQFMGRVVSLPLSTVERAGTGDLVSRTTNDVEALSHVVRFGIPSIFVAVVTVVITVRRGAAHRPAGRPADLRRRSRCSGSRRGGTSGTRRPATCASGRPTPCINGVVTETRRRRAHRRRPPARRRRRGRGSTTRSASATTPRATPCGLRLRWFPQVEFGLPAARRRSPCSGAAGWWRRARPPSGTATAVTLYVQAMAKPARRAARCGSTRSRSAPPRWPGSSASPTCRPTGSPPARRPDGADLDGRRRPLRLPPRARRAPRRLPRPATRASGWPSSARPGAGKSTLGRLMAGIDGPASGRVDVGGVPLVDLDLRPAARRGRPRHPGAPRVRRHPRRQPAAGPSRVATGTTLRRRAATPSTPASGPPALPRGLDTARRQRRPRAHRGPVAAARAGPAGARRPAHAGARRGDLAARPAGRAAPRAVAGRRRRRAAPSSPSPTGCTPPTTPTGWPWSRRAWSARSAPTTS